MSRYFYVASLFGPAGRLNLCAKRLFQARMDLAQFPEDQDQENRHQEQQELGHFVNPLGLQS